MANIILKDKNGTDITHMGIDYLCIRTLEGGLVRFNEGDIRVISVDELPSENIKEDAIYKVSATDEDGNARVVFCTYVDGEWTEYKVGKDPVFENLEITENGTYTPAEGVDGWSEVTVNVESNPVLTELVVTENGVYDEPMIGGGTPEIGMGKTVTFKRAMPPDEALVSGSNKGFTDFYSVDRVSSLVINVTNTGYEVLVELYNESLDARLPAYVYVSEGMATAGGDPMLQITDAGWHKVDITTDTITPCDPPTITIPDHGVTDDQLELMTVVGNHFFEAPSTPADGWNKVTVNVEAKTVLTELVVTENGVYDEPMISGGEPEIGMGKTVTFKESYVIDESIMKISGRPMTAERVSIYPEVVLDSAFMITVGESLVINGEQVEDAVAFYFNKAAVELEMPKDFGVFDEEEGWYYRASEGATPIKLDTPPSILLQTEMDVSLISYTSVLFAGSLVPADGWNKVTVNVPVNEPPVLAELVVTENGVYDKPVISNTPEPITWDGVVGDRVTVSITGMPYTYVKVSDVVLSADDFDGATACAHGASPVVITADMLIVTSGGVVLPETMAISISDIAAFAEAMSVTFPETGMYFAVNTSGDLYMETITFAGSPVPADGWNKVTVNVAGDIIDVDELPTENVDEGKIYRVTKESEPTVYIAGLNDNGEPMVISYAEMLYAGTSGQFNIVTHVHVVDSLPDQFEKTNIDTATMTYTVSLYIVRDTGIAYYGGPSGKLITLGEGHEVPLEDYGWVDSVDDIVPSDNMAYYTVRGSSSTTYGIPDEASNKTVMEHNGSEWVECGAGSGSGGDNTVVDVEAFPTENVDNEKIYRTIEIVSGLKLYINAGSGQEGFIDELIPASFTYIPVDELPSSLIESDLNSMTLTLYILRSTGEAYLYAPVVSETPVTFSTLMQIPFVGIATDVSEITEIGYYTVFGEDKTVVSLGVPDVDGNRTIYEFTNSGEWTNMDEAVSTAKKLEAIDTFVRNANIRSNDGVIELVGFSNGVASSMTEVIIPSWIETINSNVTLSLTNALRAEDSSGYYWQDENGKNRILIESKIGKDAEEISVMSPVEIIDRQVFSGYGSLKQISFNRDITSIGYRAFENCTSLESIVLPHDLVYFDGSCVTGCTSLKSITFPSGLKSCSSITGCPNIESVYVEEITGSAVVYAENNCLIKRESMTLLLGSKTSTVPDGTRIISPYAFADRFGFEDLVLPDSVIEVRNDAFLRCESIRTITIPESVELIRFDAFRACPNLATVTFRGAYVEIPNSIFTGCQNLTDIYVPWAEGAVANAPWGATNATIHYNYTPESAANE